MSMISIFWMLTILESSFCSESTEGIQARFRVLTNQIMIARKAYVLSQAPIINNQAA